MPRPVTLDAQDRIAEELVSSALLKRMMNHAAAGHYGAKSEAQLRAGWQAVADFVEEAAGRV